jgi:hypothetical protein
MTKTLRICVALVIGLTILGGWGRSTNGIRLSWRFVIQTASLVATGTLIQIDAQELQLEFDETPQHRVHYGTGHLALHDILFGSSLGDTLPVAWFLGFSRKGSADPPSSADEPERYEEGDTGIWILDGPGYPKTGSQYWSFVRLPQDSLEAVKQVLMQRSKQ